VDDAPSLGIDIGSLGCRFAARQGDRVLPLFLPMQTAPVTSRERNGSLAHWKRQFGRADDATTRPRLEESVSHGLVAAQQQFGSPVEDVAIAVPACFSPQQRQILYEMAMRARVADVFLISDSVAVAADRSRELPEGHLLVVHCGYSGFEIGAISVLRGRIHVLGYGGGLALSGCELDRRLFQQAAMRSFLPEQTVVNRSLTEEAIRVAASRIRNHLVRHEAVQLRFELPAGETFEGSLTQTDLRHLVTQSVEPVLAEINRVLGEARLRPTDVTEVVLAGGPTAAPGFSDAIARHVPKTVVRMHDWSVAFGAAHLAGNMTTSRAGSPAGLALYDAADAEPVSTQIEPQLPQITIRIEAVDEPDAKWLASANSAQPPRSETPPATPATSGKPAAGISASLTRKLALRSVETAKNLIHQGRLKEAVQHSHQAYSEDRSGEIFEAMLDIHCQAANASLDPEGYDQSTEWLHCALRHDPGNPRIRGELAQRHLLHARQMAERRDFRAAVSAAERAFQLRPDSTEIEQLLAQWRAEC